MKLFTSKCSFLIILLAPALSRAVTYYVATTGNDANTCAQAQFSARPKKTLKAGVACLHGGDTLVVKAGTYLKQEITNPPPGTSSKYTTIMADPTGARPLLMPDGKAGQRGFYCSNGAACHHIEFRGFKVTGAYNSAKFYGDAKIGWTHHLRIINNIFDNTVHTNMLIASSATGFIGGDHLIQGNEFFNTGVGNPGYAPGHNTIYNTGNRTVVEKNKFHNLANGIGIWASKVQVRGVVVRGNIFYDIGRSSIDKWQKGNGSFSAIHVSVPGGGHRIYNNIIYRSGDEISFAAIKVQNYSGLSGLSTDVNYIYNNTIYDIKNPNAPAVNISSTILGKNYVKNNISYLGGKGFIGGVQARNLRTNPLFTDPARANFTLKTGSPAIDTGEANTIATVDILGVARPRGKGFDIGAYER